MNSQTKLQPIPRIVPRKEPLWVLYTFRTCSQHQSLSSFEAVRLFSYPHNAQTKVDGYNEENFDDSPLATSPGLSASLGAPSPPFCLCSQILFLNSNNASPLSNLKHGCLELFSSFGPKAIWICWPPGVMSNLRIYQRVKLSF